MRLVRTALFIVAFAPPAGAQQRLGPHPGSAYALFRPAPNLPPARPTSFVQSTAPHHRDYQWEGVAIGAIVGGASGAYLVLHDPDACETRGCGSETVLGALVFGVVGGFFGGIVGALIPKKPGPSTH